LSVAQLDKQLCFALYSASSHVSGIYRAVLKPLDLTYTQFMVLMALWEKDSISISQLAKRTGLTNATMTPLLKRLEQKNLIVRELVKDNERQKNIVLTKEGRKLSLTSAEITEQAFCATGLTRQQAADLIALCKQVASQPVAEMNL